MKQVLSLFRGTCLWAAAAILALLPIVVAADFGGVLRWTHYVAALVGILVIWLTTTSLTRSDGWTYRRHALLIPLVLWLGFSLLQTLALPKAAVSWLSPASAEAYSDWINPFISADEQLASFPISLARHDSLHVCALLAVLVGIAWAAAMLFHDRKKLILLMVSLCLGGAFHAGIGVFRALFPEADAWQVASETTSTAFGAYVNRNHAALMLNFGVAFSLGLLAWRLAALSGFELDDPSFEFNDLFELSRDRDSVLGLVGAVLSITGLLICGSRGGIVAACFGILLALGWMRQRRGLASIPVITAVIALSVTVLLVPLDFNVESLRRLELLSQQDSSSILHDGRLLHWRDGLDTARAHLPMGSGLSTYAYAYLPHQQSSPQAWFQHADNLWLELIVEQGIVGLALAIVVVVMVVVALQRLAQSPDPIDHGLRITGWYFLAATLVSQFFDFGLIAFGNLLVAAVLLPTLVSRACAVHSTASSGGRVIIGRGQQLAVLAIAIAAIALPYSSLPKLQRDAETESLTRMAQGALQDAKPDAETLAALSSQLERVVGDDPSPEALDTLSDLEYRRARMIEVLESNPANIEEAEQRYEATSRTQKRVVVRDSNGSNDASAANYTVPFELAKASLKILPLNPNPRWTILSLDFLASDSQFTQATLSQLRQLYPNDPNKLFKIGQMAADGGQNELAAEIWHSTLQTEPRWTQKVMVTLEQYPDVQPSKVLPDGSVSLTEAAPYLLKDATKNRELLVAAYEKMHCQDCESRTKRARFEELRGDVAYAVGQHENAFEKYRSALEMDSENANLRIKLITRLRAQGHRRAAFQAARLARLTIPDDERFTKLIDSMAAADRRELMESR